MKLSVIIPCYNEKRTIEKIIDKIYKFSNIKNKEIIVVDDGSTDGTREILKKLKYRIKKTIFLKKFWKRKSHKSWAKTYFWSNSFNPRC